MIHTQINKQTHVRSFIHSSSMHTTDTQTNILTKYTIQTLNQIQILHLGKKRREKKIREKRLALDLFIKE